MKRPRKITLAQALRHPNQDFAGHCESCGYNRVIRREDILAMQLPAHMRIDQLEARYQCTRCGARAISFQTRQRNAPYSDGFRSS